MIRYTLLSFFFFIAITHSAFAQGDDELKGLLKKAKQASNDKQKVDAYFDLADYYFLNNTKVSDSLAFLGEATAEETRDRSVMVNAYLRDASRFLMNTIMSENLDKSIKKAEKALKLSRQVNDPELIVKCYNLLGRAYRGLGEPDKSIKVCNDAVALFPEVENDSLKIYTYNNLGRSLRYKSDLLNAFKAFLSGLTIAEEASKPSLIIYCYQNLEDFYIDIKNFEKAKDYAFKALAMDKKTGDTKRIVKDYISIASIYTNAKENDMATLYYDKADKLADSIHSKPDKIAAKLGLVNMYLNTNQFKEGCDILLNDPLIFNYLREVGGGHEIDKAKGLVHMMLGNYDSSLFYYKKAERVFDKGGASSYQRFNFYLQYSGLFKALKQWNKAIEYQTKAKESAQSNGDLSGLDVVVQELDSLYYYNGDFKNAYKYQVLHQQLADSLQKLSEQKDILGLEIDNENKRTERAKVLEEQELNRRHNLQYMGITAAIGAVFIFLVTLGLFKVSASVVKATGFFAFIFLFEFIILILDNQIHHLTHGEPWKVLLIKIFLIAMLLPFHHWLEEKVIHFLIEHRLLLTKRLDWLKVKKKEEIPGAH